jgi:large subunit ribosomal protein L25
MKSVSLNAFPRTLGRRGGSKKLRSSGRIPAIIYGRQATPQSLEVNSRDMENLMTHAHGENVLVDLAIDKDGRPKRLALVQEVQHHPLNRHILHVDFHEVAENEKVTIKVPVETTGEAIGVKASGGVLEHVLFKISLRALPKDLPEVIRVDVSKLDLNQTIHLGEIPVPAGVEVIGDKEIPVISCAAPRTEEEEAAATAEGAAAAGEVEMIKEKKEDGEAPAAGEKGAAKAGDKGAAKPAAGAAKPAAGEKAADKGAGAKPAEKKK